jgi:GMP synthase (glutamine-hydrolysing)
MKGVIRVQIHFIIHEVFEGPGAFLTWAKMRGHSIGYSRVYQGEPLPLTIENIDLLIVMGGPQSPSTTVEMCPHFDGAAEIALIRNCIDSGKAVIGVCLGSQLIGEAYGAKCEKSPEKEIGCFPITLTEAGRENEFFSHFDEVSKVGHWHNDMPGLTKSCQVIAYSEGCPRQIVQYDTFVYGFQCHMEFTHELVELLIEHSEIELQRDKNNKFVHQAEELRQNGYTTMNHNLFVFLDKFTDAYLQI